MQSDENDHLNRANFRLQKRFSQTESQFFNKRCSAQMIKIL